MLEINSFSNSKCKYVRSLSQKKARRENGEYTVEGVKSVCDALRSDRRVSALWVSKSFYNNAHFEYPPETELYVAADEVFGRICDTKTPQGILAIVKMENSSFTPDLSERYIYCDGISDPGNLGTIIRTADAAGFDAVLLSEGCADLYSPKTVRASMGSYFNMNVYEGKTAADLAELKEQGFSLAGGALNENTVDYREFDYSKPLVIIVGNEANGISDEVLSLCQGVKIPILGKAESLNAAVAAAVLMYESVRQRT